MARTLSFVKMSGAGNDFIMIDNRDGVVAEGAKAELARAVCPRRTAVGADGLILLERSETCDVRMRIFNADGSEAEMCGNGSRCLAEFAHSVGAVGTTTQSARPGAAGLEMTIETVAGPVRAKVREAGVLVELTSPGEIISKGELEFAGSRGEVFFTDTGVPHAVLFTDDLEGTDVRTLGRAIRFHEAFGRPGANANFVRVAGPGKIGVRTYERGVEDETLACGTGATAAGLICAWREGWDSPVEVSVRSGGTLKVHFRGAGPRFEAASLEGPVSVAYRGEVEREG